MQRTKLTIHFWGDKILRKKCKVVKEVNDEICFLLHQMYALMQVSNGLGLAANQAGIGLRLVVVQVEEDKFMLVNPKIIKRENKIQFEEGCLSFPGINLRIKRYSNIWVSSLDEKGNPQDIEAQGVLAVVLQHEIDHLNGIVFIDHISFLEKIKLKSKLKEIKKLSH